MLASPALTNLNGRFSTDSSQPGLVAFAPGCVDNLARSSIKYWNTAPTTPGVYTTLSPVTTLVEAYRRFQCNAGAAECKSIGDASLYNDVYSMFGFPEQPGVDFRSWDGIVMGTKYGLSVYVLNQRVATVLTAASELAASLCGDDFSASDNTHVQLAVQYAVVEVLLSKATADDRVAALSNPEDIAAIMEATLANLKTPEAGLGSCKNIEAADRAVLFPVLAKVRGTRLGEGTGCFVRVVERVGGWPGTTAFMPYLPIHLCYAVCCNV